MVRRAVENVAVLAASILLGFAVLEGVARFLPTPQGAYTGRGLYRADFDLGHSLRPTYGAVTSTCGSGIIEQRGAASHPFETPLAPPR